MSVRFILGRARSGKTHHCATHIAQATADDPLGPPILWLLPKQATFQAERLLTQLTGGYLRASVLSFEQLLERILHECGGAAIPEVTPLGRQMILAHLLRK